MAKTLIATLYSLDPVLIAAHKLGPDKLILLTDEKPDHTQQKNLQTIQESLGRIITVEHKPTKVYDIVDIATTAVNIIDAQPKNDTLYINITTGRKTKALGLLFASYARSNRIKKIAYNPEEDENAVVWLPKLQFKLSESQHQTLDAIAHLQHKNFTISELGKNMNLSKAMLYRNIEDLKNLGYITIKPNITLTDAGKIARL